MPMTIGTDSMDPKLFMVHTDGEPFAWTKCLKHAKLTAVAPDLLVLAKFFAENTLPRTHPDVAVACNRASALCALAE